MKTIQTITIGRDAGWRLACVALVAGAMLGAGCTHKIDVQPIKVEPIHMTLDINIKVERELDDFFDFEDRAVSSDVEIDPDEPPVPPPAGPLSNATPEGGAA